MVFAAQTGSVVGGVVLVVVGVTLLIVGSGFLRDFRGWASQALSWRSRTSFGGRLGSERTITWFRRVAGTIYVVLGVTFLIIGFTLQA